MLLRLFATALLVLSFVSLPSIADETSPKNDSNSPLTNRVNRVLFLGDSITHAGHYVSMIELRLRLSGIDKEIINLGLPSETCSGLSEPDHPFPRPDVHERLERALTKVKPDLVVACYGMNDGIYYPFSDERFAAYKAGVQKLIKKVNATGAKLVLMTPPPFDPLPLKKKGKLLPDGEEKYAWFSIYEDYDSVMDKYADYIMSQKDDVLMTIDLHTPVNEYTHQQRKENADFTMSNDGVHLDVKGHRILADVILGAWGYESAAKSGDDLLKLVHRRQMTLQAAWLSHVGHKRPGVKAGLPMDEATESAAEQEKRIAEIIERQRPKKKRKDGVGKRQKDKVKEPSQASSRPRGQYKKKNRDLVRLIAEGKTEQPLEQCDKMLKDFPADLEAMFLQVLAHCKNGDAEQAWRRTEAAVKAGLEVERFLAGPREMLEPLYGHPQFQALAKSSRTRLLHGPVVSCVTDVSASFWVRSKASMEIQVELSDDPDFESSIRTEVVASREEDDFTAVAEANGLAPSTRYYYRCYLDGQLEKLSDLPSFVTAPKVGASGKYTIGFGGGAGFTPWLEHMWLTILKRQPQAFLLLGDNVYIDAPQSPETQLYCYYRRQSRPEYRKFAASTPLFAIWDDHDFGTNDCTSSLKLDEPPWKMDVLRVFKQNFANPAYGGAAKKPGVWFKFSYGDVEFFMLDCRFYRQNPNAFDDPSMLGPDQLKWLQEELKKSTATFKVVASSVPFAFGVKGQSKDTWLGFQQERERIFQFIEDQRIEGVVLISADRHRSDARIINRPNGYDFYEFESSKLTNVHTHPAPKGTLIDYHQKCSYGALGFDTTKEDPELTYRIVNIDDQDIGTVTIRRSQLQFPKDK